MRQDLEPCPVDTEIQQPVFSAATEVSPSPSWGLIVGWVAIFLASELDFIVSDLAGLNLPSWSTLVRAAMLLIIAIAIPRSTRLVHVRGFVFALAAITAGSWAVYAIQSQVHWFTVATRAQGMLARVFLNLIPAALAAITFIGSGISRRDLFLQRGELSARTSLPFMRSARWSVVAPILLVCVSGGLLVQLWIVSRASQHFHPAMLIWGFPAALLFAIINATWEEFCFRCVLLARGIRAFGAAPAIATSSVLFGLAHYGGHPSGFSGVLMAAFFAWIVARSMVDTRGWTYAWLLHVVQDVIIFLMVTMTCV